MTVLARSWVASAFALALGACAPSFSIVVAEFDAVAGWRPGQGEPELVSYSAESEQLPALVRFLHTSGLDLGLVEMTGVEFTKTTLLNPAGYARQRMMWMAGNAVGDSGRTALAVARLGWALDGDPQPLNQIIALNGLAALARELGVDPLGDDAVPRVSGSDERLAVAWHPPMAQLRAVAQAVADGGETPPDTVAAALEAIARSTSLAPPTPRDRRAQVLVLSYLARRSGSHELRAAAGARLGVVLAWTIADALQRAVFEPRDGSVRAYAARVCFGLGGDDAAARVLRLSSAPADQRTGTGYRYDPDPDVRLALVRLCSQVTTEHAFEGHRGGPSVVEFLYDAIADNTGRRGLRAAALDALALTLGQPMVADRGWADRWYAEFVKSRGATR